MVVLTRVHCAGPPHAAILSSVDGCNGQRCGWHDPNDKRQNRYDRSTVSLTLNILIFFTTFNFYEASFSEEPTFIY